MKNYLIILSFFAFSIVNSFSQKKAFTIEDLYKVKYPGAPVLSPDAKQFAFTITHQSLQKAKSYTDIYVMDADGKNRKQITNNNKSYDPIWGKDGQTIYFTSIVNGTPQLFKYDIKDTTSTQITEFSMGIDAPVLSPDNNYIAFTAEVYPECGADSKANEITDSLVNNGPVQAVLADHLLFRHWTHYTDKKVSHIIIYNINTKKYTDLTPGQYSSPIFMLGGGTGYNFSPDSKEICYVSNHEDHPEASTNADLFLVSVNGGEAKNITKENKAWDGSPKYSPDGKYIAYRQQKIPGYESDLFRLALYNRETGETKTITENWDFWIDDYKWDTNSKEIYFQTEKHGYEPLFSLNLKNLKIKAVSGEETSVMAFDMDNKGNLFYSSNTTGKPSELYKMQIKNKETLQLTDINTDLCNKVDIRPADTLWVKASDGCDVEIFIVKPHNFDPNKKYPLILNVHGGPQMQWMNSFRGDWQVYPGSGYIVAYPNPHGSTGYGQKFTRAISGDWGGKVFDDLMKVTDKLAQLSYVDSTRMGAMGWSYGGYMMNWFQGHTKRFKCLASMMGVYDLRSMWGSTEEVWFPNFELQGQPWNSDLYAKFSPSFYAKNFATPTLVMTGQIDFRVPYTQSIQYFTTLQTLNIPSRLIILKNDGHWPNGIKSMPLYYDAHLDWFHKYLGGDPAPYDVEKMIKNKVF